MTSTPDFGLGPDTDFDTGIDPDRDLLIERIIRAPRQAVWSAWTDPAQLVQWWIPSPLVLRVDALDLRPGGAFVTLGTITPVVWVDGPATYRIEIEALGDVTVQVS